MNMFLNMPLLIMIAAVPTFIIFILQLLLCRFSKRPIVSLIPFWIVVCFAIALGITLLTGGIKSTIHLYIMLYLLETVSCMLLGDIIGWLLGLFWRGFHICSVREKALASCHEVSLAKVSNTNTENIDNLY